MHDGKEVIYEVSLDVDVGILEEYRPWLRHHAQEMVALPGFLGAEIQEQQEPSPMPGRILFCVAYRLRDRAALDAYLQDHAARMRADGAARFGDSFRASRRILQATDRY